MSVEYIKGDLLDWPAGINVIAHGVSRQAKMGKGIAKQIADRYPDAKQAYLDAFAEAGQRGGYPQLGDIVVAKVENDTKRIVHAFTQDDIGTDRRQLNYEALHVALTSLRDMLESARAEGREWVLGIPQWIGCGLAGGHSAVVQAHVESIFWQSPVRCVVVEYAQ